MVDFKLHRDSSPKKDLLTHVFHGEIYNLALRFVGFELHQLWAEFFFFFRQGMVVFICVLCCIMGIVLFGFFGWHLYLVKAGAPLKFS